jgi:hypothetical protein
MITSFKTARRNLVVATALLATAGLAHAAKVDPTIAASQTALQNAPIEDVVQVAHDTALQIGSGAIKLKTVNTGALARFAAEAILAKPAGPPENSTINKTDELAEAIANIVFGIISNPKFTKTSVGNSNVKTIMNQGLRAVKSDPVFSTTNVFIDVARSVAVTLANNPAISDKQQGKLFKYLTKTSKKIAGKPNQTGIKNGLAEGFNTPTDPTVAGKAEDANLYASIHQIDDPETDFRPA